MTPFPEPFASAVVLLVGLVLGSFLNVCIYRMPLGRSIVWPGSSCPACGDPILWHRNVPVLSWILLRGRCAACRAPISWRYPFVEALTGLLLLGLWRLFGPDVSFAIAGPFALAMIVLFFTDLDHQLLPDKITLGGLAAGLAVAWFNPFLDGLGTGADLEWLYPFPMGPGWSRVWGAVGGAALGAGLLWGFGALYGALRKVEAMGMGDVKMMAMVGAFTGPWGVALTIFGGSLVGALVGLALIPLRGRTLRDALPFGCFLAPAALAVLLAGRRMAEFYLGLVIPLPGSGLGL